MEQGGIEFRKITELPNKKLVKSIEKSVRKFVRESNQYDTPCDEEGVYQQSIQTIAHAIVDKNEKLQFWLANYNNEVIAYAICHISIDVDNTKCYWVTQGYLNKKVRRHRIIKIWREQLWDEAKNLSCRHIIAPSSRNNKAYLRWLGEGWHEYVTLLKKDL